MSTKGRRWLVRMAAVALAAMFIVSTANAQGTTLHILMEDVPETQIVENLLPQFEKQTGIKVDIQKLVYSEMHDKLVTQLVSSSSYYNVLEVDFLWAGEFPAAGWLTPLQPYVDKSNFDLKPFIPSMLDLVGNFNKKLYMIPMYNYSMGLIYRKDLLADPKLQSAYQAQYGTKLAVPTTLAEYVQVSKFMKAHADVAGAAMQGQRGDPNSMEFSNYLFAAGGHYQDASGKVTLDSPAGLNALNLYVDNIQNASQKGSLSATLDDTFKLMCQGKAWSMVTYWWMLPQLDNASSCPNVAGKVALDVMPGGHGESGGWGWAIPHNESPQLKDAAWQFISWVQSKKVAVERALQGHAPVRSDVFEDPAVLQKYPYYKEAENVVKSGEAFPVFTYSAQYEDVLGRQLSLAAANQAKPQPALTAAAKGLEQLLAKAKSQ